MAYSIAANSRLAGSAKGNFLDDLTNPVIGQWPKTQAIKRITRISVFAGGIVDSLRITYQVENAPAPITVQHGGPGGAEALSFEIGGNIFCYSYKFFLFTSGITLITVDEKLVAVYGTRHVNAGPYGDKNIVQLSFVVVNSAGNAPTTKVYTGSGNSRDPTEKFDLSWPLTAASSYTFQPPGAPVSYLQAIGFSKVLGEAGSPMI
ncbi:hypothetical protein EDB87DRAFT_1606767 [Lactarius vividus]|nr:hypothetical protein EDB87DRAFT_1606767 [Lactarius vividus]